MANIRLKKITIEPLQEPLVIQNGYISISNTTPSSGVTGSLLTNGGISILCSSNATSSTAGGGLSISGGIGVLKDIYVGGNIILDNFTNVLRLKGITQDRMFLDSALGKQFHISVDGLNKQFEINGTNASFNSTASSLNSSSGALVINGGVSISNTGDASSFTAGGGLTIAGGMSIHKNVKIGLGLEVGNSITTANIQSINITSTDSTCTNFNTTNITSSSILASNIQSNTASITNLLATSITSSTVFISTIASNVISSGTISAITFTGANAQLSGTISCGSIKGTTINGTTYTGHNASIINISATNLLVPNLSTQRITADSLEIFTPSGHNPPRFQGPGDWGIFQVVPNSTNQNVGFGLYTNTNGTAVTAGDVWYPNVRASNKNFWIQTSGLGPSMVFDLNGQVGIGTTSPGERLDIRGNLRVGGNTQANYISFFGTAGDGVGHTYIGERIYAGTEKSELLLFKGNDIDATFGPDRIRLLAAEHRFEINILSGTFDDIGTSGGTLQMIIATSGNVGIGTSSPSYPLDVNGTIECNDSIILANTVSQNSTTGALLMNGGISISNTTDANSSTQGGTLTTLGGIGISKRLFVGGVAEFSNTTPSESISSGSVIVKGGLSIQGTQNASAVSNGGALTVNGGASVNGDLWIGGTIISGGGIGGGSGSTFAELTVTSTKDAINASTGSLITNGGVTIKNSRNAINTSNGGALLVQGGASINRDVYIGGSLNLPYSNTLRISNTNSFNGEIYMSSGSPGTLSLDALGSGSGIRVRSNNSSFTFVSGVNFARDVFSINNGGDTFINSTTNASGLGTGGGLNILGGASIAKDTYIGGDVNILSTTASTNVSTGALRLSGGMAVSGNLNVLGNSTIIGNLTVSGTTTSIESTTTSLKDNVFVLNSGPNGTRDSGVLIQRFQEDNNTGAGDVVNNNDYLSDTLPDQTGMTSSQVKFSSSASSSNDFYIGWWLKVASGFVGVVNQVRKITAYNGTTKVATLSSSWASPSMGDSVYLYNKPFVGLIYNEIADRFEFGSTVQDPGQTNVSFTDNLPIVFSNGTVTSTQESVNASTGSLIMNGGLSINNSTNATSNTRGGALTIAGGASISRSMFVGNQLTVSGTTNASNVGTGGSLTVLGGASISKDVYVGGTLTSSSDVRLKENIEEISISLLDKIDALRVVKFNFRWDKEHRHIGFIAQDFAENFPELVRQSQPDGLYTMDYPKVTAILMQCIKELKQEIKDMKTLLEK